MGRKVGRGHKAEDRRGREEERKEANREDRRGG